MTFVRTKDGKVKSVDTDRGNIECEVFVNTTGMVCTVYEIRWRLFQDQETSRLQYG